MGAVETELLATIETRLGNYVKYMEAMEVRKSAQELRALWAAGNEYLQTVAPWSTFKSDPEQAALQTRIGLNLAVAYGVLSSPFLPDASERILQSFPTANHDWPRSMKEALERLQPGDAFSVPEVLFAKVSDEATADWKERFAGGRDA